MGAAGVAINHSAGMTDVVRLLARVTALQDFIATDDGRDLVTAYKRAANILKKEEWSSSAPLPVREGRNVIRP